MITSRQDSAASMRALIGVIMIGMVAHAGLPYLPLNGPPTMRIAAAKKPDVAPIIALEKERAKAFSNSAAAIEMPSLAATKPDSSMPETNAMSPALLQPSASFTDVSISAPVFNLTEQGMQTITPQMLAAYFRPLNVGTNGGVISGVLPMGFIPPFTRPEAHPDSRAEYIVK